MKNYPFIFFIAVLFAYACSDKEDEEPQVAKDPLIGLWKMVEVEQNGQSVDVTEQACLQDSRFDVQEKTMTLTLSAPEGQGNNDCQTETLSVPWEKEDGVYYMIENGERKPARLALNNDDQELQVDINLESDPLTLIFAKE